MRFISVTSVFSKRNPCYPPSQGRDVNCGRPLNKLGCNYNITRPNSTCKGLFSPLIITFFHIDLPELLEAYKKKDVVIKEFEAAKLKLKKAKSLLQMAELNKMKRVLRRMNYCDQVIQTLALFY